jgi:hypothetical protein
LRTYYQYHRQRTASAPTVGLGAFSGEGEVLSAESGLSAKKTKVVFRSSLISKFFLLSIGAVHLWMRG